MKCKFLGSIWTLSLLAALAMPLRVVAQKAKQQQAEHHRRYTVTDLGPAGNPFSQANYVNNAGLIAGLDTATDGSQHAVLWYEGLFEDISQPGLGGPNSGAGGANDFGQVIGGAETSEVDPNNENFCGYATGLECLAFLWENGVMTALPRNGDIHAFLATPCNRDQADKDVRMAPAEGAAAEGAVTTERPRPVLSENARKQLQKMLRFHLAGPQPTQAQ